MCGEPATSIPPPRPRALPRPMRTKFCAHRQPASCANRRPASPSSPPPPSRPRRTSQTRRLHMSRGTASRSQARGTAWPGASPGTPGPVPPPAPADPPPVSQAVPRQIEARVNQCLNAFPATMEPRGRDVGCCHPSHTTRNCFQPPLLASLDQRGRHAECSRQAPPASNRPCLPRAPGMSRHATWTAVAHRIQHEPAPCRQPRPGTPRPRRPRQCPIASNPFLLVSFSAPVEPRGQPVELMHSRMACCTKLQPVLSPHSRNPAAATSRAVTSKRRLLGGAPVASGSTWEECVCRGCRVGAAPLGRRALSSGTRDVSTI